MHMVFLSILCFGFRGQGSLDKQKNGWNSAFSVTGQS